MNSILTGEVQGLADAIRNHRALTSIYLGVNVKISSEGIKAILDAVKDNELTTFDLGYLSENDQKLLDSYLE